jgi:hypothetical protein
LAGIEWSLRVQLFEFEDQVWFPAPLRRAMQSYLAAAYRLTPFPKLWAERLASILSPNWGNELVDLASGAAGPLTIVIEELRNQGFQVDVTLTDLFPNPKSSPFPYWPDPVDARRIPEGLQGIRTMFASFHHFRPEDAHGILQDAFDHRLPICVFEATSATAALTAILIPVLVLVLTPRVRPFSWCQIFFTYLIPILPILIFWDGLVSHLRTYSVAELKGLTRDLQSQDYTWQIGLIKPQRAPFGVPYLIGCPAPANWKSPVRRAL